MPFSRRLLEACSGDDTLLGSANVSASIFILLLLGFVLGSIVTWAIFCQIQRKARRYDLEFRTRFGSSQNEQAPDVSTLIKSAHTPTIRPDSKDQWSCFPHSSRLPRTAATLASGPLAVGYHQSLIGFSGKDYAHQRSSGNPFSDVGQEDRPIPAGVYPLGSRSTTSGKKGFILAFDPNREDHPLHHDLNPLQQSLIQSSDTPQAPLSQNNISSAPGPAPPAPPGPASNTKANKGAKRLNIELPFEEHKATLVVSDGGAVNAPTVVVNRKEKTGAEENEDDTPCDERSHVPGPVTSVGVGSYSGGKGVVTPGSRSLAATTTTNIISTSSKKQQTTDGGVTFKASTPNQTNIVLNNNNSSIQKREVLGVRRNGDEEGEGEERGDALALTPAVSDQGTEDYSYNPFAVSPASQRAVKGVELQQQKEQEEQDQSGK